MSTLEQEWEKSCKPNLELILKRGVCEPYRTRFITSIKSFKEDIFTPIIHSQTQLLSTVFRNPTSSSPCYCLKTTCNAAFPITSFQAKLSLLIPESFKYYELIPDDLFPQSEDQEMPPLLSPTPVTSSRIQSSAVIDDLIDSASLVQ